MNAIELEIFRNIFASIAEEMGATLMRSAFSPNIKERRDYSCAVFDAEGGMVAQAAHIPVHLGSTPMSVRAALDAFGALAPAQHVVSNDPYSGGTHLPDITVVSPVHDAAGELRFLVANRAHHADVGGIAPGSLPISSSVDDEGIRIPPTLWSAELEAAICSASRTPKERRGDLAAQLAANRRGAARLAQWMERPGFVAAAKALQDHSEAFMRNVLQALPSGEWIAEDVMDGDGFDAVDIPIRCRLVLRGGSALVDFGGSSPQVRGPVNVPRAVTVSAVMYAFRCLAPADLPSNAGYMRCIDVRTEPGSLVDALEPAAVAAGNVETSQRITDVVFAALAQAMPERIPASSAGTMNNVLVGRGGDDPFAYYETIAGGAGGGPSRPGATAIQTHMTNTLNTPVEALEHAYPMRMVEYAIREGSGGEGRHRGGDGVVRHYEFLSPATVTVVTERRRRGPPGAAGGGDGAPGENWLHRGETSEELPAKSTFEVSPGDRLEVRTPGGGGWGISEG